MTTLHFIDIPWDGARYPYEEGALDGLTGEERRQVASSLAREAWQHGHTDYVITRADVLGALA